MFVNQKQIFIRIHIFIQIHNHNRNHTHTHIQMNMNMILKIGSNYYFNYKNSNNSENSEPNLKNTIHRSLSEATNKIIDKNISNDNFSHQSFASNVKKQKSLKIGLNIFKKSKKKSKPNKIKLSYDESLLFFFYF